MARMFAVYKSEKGLKAMQFKMSEHLTSWGVFTFTVKSQGLMV